MEMDSDNDGTIDHREFMAYWAPGQKEDLDVTGGIVGGDHPPTTQEAKAMIRSAIEARLESAPGGLRRAFKIFDRDGSGQISAVEFKDMLKHYIMLEFDDATMAAVMNDFDPDGTGGIDFNEFCTLVMGESRHGPFGTGATAPIPAPTIRADSDVIMELREKLLASGQSATPLGKATQLHKLLKLQDSEGCGCVGASAFKRSLARAGAPLSDDEFNTLASVVSEHGKFSGTIDYAKLTNALKAGNTSAYAGRGGGSAAVSPKQSPITVSAYCTLISVAQLFELHILYARPLCLHGRVTASTDLAWFVDLHMHTQDSKNEREALWVSAAADAARSPSRQSSQGAAVVADLAAIAAVPRAIVESPTKKAGRRDSTASNASRRRGGSFADEPPGTARSGSSARRASSYRCASAVPLLTCCARATKQIVSSIEHRVALQEAGHPRARSERRAALATRQFARRACLQPKHDS